MVRFENPPLELNSQDRKLYNYLYQVAERLNLLLDTVENGSYATGEEAEQGRIGNTSLTINDLAEMLQQGSVVGDDSVYSMIKQTKDAIKLEVTRATTAEGSLSASITVNANAITSEVTRATAAEGTLSSSITQQATEISLKVSKGSVISEINQSAEAITINANKVNLSGYVTFSNLSTSGQTTINGANITTGTLDCEKLIVNGKTFGSSSSKLSSLYSSGAYINDLRLPTSGSSSLNIALGATGVSQDGGSTYTSWATICAGGTQTAKWG